MKRLLLDTNIYGLIVVDTERNTIHGRMHKNKEVLLIYGFSIIRNELRDVPKKIRQKGRKLRVDLLSTYDEFVKKNYSLNKEISILAEDYFELYRQFGGSISKNKIINDFLIVACASLHDLDLVVSEDNHSMLTDNALRAYKNVNKIKELKLPDFISYEDFKNELKK
jgi:hypothetical protein